MMKARNRVSLALAILTSVCLVGAANPAAANGNCEHVTGEFVFSSLVFTSPTTAVGDGNVTGDFPGTFHADYFEHPARSRRTDQDGCNTRHYDSRGHTRHLRRDPPHPPG